MKLRLSPSSAHTWTVCTAQPHYLRQHNDRLPQGDTDYSREGTVAHAVIEHLFQGKLYENLDGYKPEMEDHALDFIALCREMQGGVKTPWWSEVKVPLFYAPESNGIVDFAAFTAKDDLVIVDYKYGKGVAVNAFENLQMAIYAVALLRVKRGLYNTFSKVTMVIHQPRVREGDTITKWTLTYGDLLQFVEDRVNTAVDAIKESSPKRLTFAPGQKVCQFCPAKGFCGLKGYEPEFPYSGRLKAEAAVKGTLLEGVTKGLKAKLEKPEVMEQSALVSLVRQAKAIRKALDHAEEYVTAMLQKGESMPGLKLVQGKGAHRAWRSEEDAKEFLLKHCKREEVIAEKLVSPAQADKFEHDLPKDEWEMLQKLVFKPEGGPVLAPEEDPRPAFSSSKASEYFDEEE